MSTKINVYQELVKQNEAAKFFLRTPLDTVSQFADYADWTQSGTMFNYGCGLDGKLTPPLAGDFTVIVARPGNRKTGFMLTQAKRYAEICSKKEIIIYATWDESVEALEGYLHAPYGDFTQGGVAWGQVSRNQAVKASFGRIEKLSSLWIWGKSIMDNKQKKPLFTIDLLFNTIQEVHRNFGLTVRAVFLDYLQIIPTQEKFTTKTDRVGHVSWAAKELAIDIGCPLFGGVQASRETASTKDKMPTLEHAQHSSEIEQHATKFLSLMTPIKYKDEGEDLQIAGRTYSVTDWLTIVRILKQRGARGAGTFALEIDPGLNIRDARAVI